MSKETNFWDVVNDHPIVSLFALSSVVSGVVNIACTLMGKTRPGAISISTSVEPVDPVEKTEN